MTQGPSDRSYRALFRVPSLGRILLGMGFARVAQAMVAIALVLFTLAEYRVRDPATQDEDAVNREPHD